MSSQSQHASLKDYLKSLYQYLIPHHLLSRLMGKVTHCRLGLIKNPLIRTFSRLYEVNMEEADRATAADYQHFNDFFTRALKPGARPCVSAAGQLASPVDGAISQLGHIKDNQLLQAKGHAYSVETLLGDKEMAGLFEDGEFATIYLSPKDYHRIHMPTGGRLLEMRHVPGRLFSVSPATTRVIPGLFARNERVVTLFETEHGPMAMVLVGAIFVASVETTWAGVITPPAGRSLRTWDYRQDQQAPQLAIGEEMGRFNMGSTVILLFAKDRIRWSEGMVAGKAVRLGGLLAEPSSDS